MTATGLMVELYRALGGVHATDHSQDARVELSAEADGIHLSLRRCGGGVLDWRVLHGVHVEQLLEHALSLVLRGSWDEADAWMRGDLEFLVRRLDET